MNIITYLSNELNLLICKKLLIKERYSLLNISQSFKLIFSDETEIEIYFQKKKNKEYLTRKYHFSVYGLNILNFIKNSLHLIDIKTLRNINYLSQLIAHQGHNERLTIKIIKILFNYTDKYNDYFVIDDISIYDFSVSTYFYRHKILKFLFNFKDRNNNAFPLEKLDVTNIYCYDFIFPHNPKKTKKVWEKFFKKNQQDLGKIQGYEIFKHRLVKVWEKFKNMKILNTY